MKNIYDLRSKLKHGFTLIELLIVIAIIGIMVAMIVPNLTGARERARDSRRKTDLNSLQQALRMYYNDNQSFPLSDLSDLTSGDTKYMNSIPVDPSTSTVDIPYTYHSDSGNTYYLYANLENLSDPDILASQARCSGPNDANIYIVCEE